MRCEEVGLDDESFEPLTRSNFRHVRGVTLIELMVTVSIMSIMVMIAAPSLQSFVRSTQLRTSTNDLATVLVYARSEAIKRGYPVTVCKSANITASSPACTTGSTATWQAGWLVFVDHDGDGTVDAGTPADVPLRIGSASTEGVSISGGTNFANYIKYLPNGVSEGGGASASGSFDVCYYGEGRSINIGPTGRTQVESKSC